MPDLKRLAIAAAIALSLAHHASAAPVTVDFSASPSGFYANGTVIDGVAFGNTGASAAFYIADYGVSSIGHGLETYDPGTPGQGGLRMSFASSMNTLSLVFGNDDPAYTFPGSLAVLELFLSGNLVGTASVVMNRDDAANQTVAFAGTAFDSALFYMADADGISLANFSEVVDNVTYSSVQEVPEPTTLALATLGLVGAGAMRRRHG